MRMHIRTAATAVVMDTRGLYSLVFYRVHTAARLCYCNGHVWMEVRYVQLLRLLQHGYIG